jgi:lipid-binding SYLF domain-containing protein
MLLIRNGWILLNRDFHMKKHHLFALLLIIAPTVGVAEISLDGVKASAAKAAKAVGDTTGKVTGAVNETIDSTKKSLRDEATPEATRTKLDAMAEKTLARLFSEQPASRELFDRSTGYAVFDAREASFYVVAGYGRGVAVNLQTDSRTYMKMATAGSGLCFGIGGFETLLVILFEDGGQFAEFIDAGVDATAEAGTMTGEKKDQLALRFNEGKAVFVLTKKGWKVAAKLTGSRYWPDDELN